MTPKRQRDATLQSQKDNLRQMEAQEEQRLARGQREYLDLEIRKFRRKKLLIFHSLEQELLREVFISLFQVFFSPFFFTQFEEFLNFIGKFIAGIEQKATAVGTGARNALETSREDTGARVSATAGCTFVTRGSGPATTRYRTYQSAGLYATCRARSTQETRAWAQTTTEELESN